MNFSLHSCLACFEPRVLDSAFCSEHKARHSKSKWVKAWRAYQKECSRVGYKNAYWVAPK